MRCLYQVKKPCQLKITMTERNKKDQSWLDEARTRYIESGSKKISDLEQTLDAIESEPDNKNHRRRLGRLLHNLIGSGASYGFPEVSEIARYMAECMKSKPKNESPMSEETIKNLRIGVRRLRDLFEKLQA